MEHRRRMILRLFALFILQIAIADGAFTGYYPSVLVQRREPLPGSPSKLHEINFEPTPSPQTNKEVNVDKIFKKFGKRSRRSINPDFNPKIVEMNLNDSHHKAYVHWSGDNHETVVVLTVDPVMTSRSTSAVWISRDYAQTFENYTKHFNLSNGDLAQINLFYSSPIDKTKYLFTDRKHKMIYSTTDDCRTFEGTAVSFTPDDISFHVSNPNVVLAYDKTSSVKRLYVSRNFGKTWTLKDERVKTYYWGIAPFESTDTLFIERLQPTGGTSVVIRTDYHINTAVSLISGVTNFEVMDGYMFATKRNGSRTSDGLILMVSLNRGHFKAAQIPTKMPSMDFVVCDASENQVFLAVSHSMRTTHLYVSDTSGVKYTLSLSRVLYFSYKTGSPWLRRYIKYSFVDIHKVASLRGVYIATQLTPGRVGHRHLVSKITFNKGGDWRLLEAPKMDNNDRPINCLLPNCSLHVSQEFGSNYPYTRYTPMLSSANAPGLVMAMGTMGHSLRTNADVFLSSNGGLTWHEVLRGAFYYNMGDHGGILIAVPRWSPTNLIYYSWNEGETWLTKKFLDNERMRVYGLLTEPGEQNTKFTIFGSHIQKHEWTVVHIDLRKTLGNPCTPQDYKIWIPRDERNASACLLGMKSSYERRIAHAHCFNGYDYDRAVLQIPCPCVREDFECDMGYVLSGSSCVWDTTNGILPTSAPSYCPAGTYYTRTKGYRKVAGDGCVGGKEDMYTPSRVSCPVSSLPEFILYAKQTAIKRLSLPYYYETTLPLSGLRQTIAVDFDYKDNCVYWADISRDTISRAFMNGSGITQVLHTALRQVEGLALDWLSNNIYWVDAGAKKIEVSRKDGRYRKVLFTEKLDRPRALVLDPIVGYMYWTDWGTKPVIVRAHMSGSNRSEIITTNLRWPNGITIDFVDKKLYWTDAGRDRIERANLDGSSREVVVSVGIPHPYSISIYRDWMFWDDWSTHSIMRAQKRRGDMRRIVKSGLRGIMDLKVFHRDIQQGSNSCSNQTKCKFLCLASPVRPNYKCACPDNMITVISHSGSVTCECTNGEVLVNGQCQALSGTCASNQFLCNNRKCIPSSWRCDHENDCGDNSDERLCPSSTCKPTDFRCASGRCIRQSWRCDHDDDCGDMSDERNCTFTTCRPTQFTCNNHRCISRRWVCDFDDDCRDGSDERGCTPAPTTSPSPSSCSSSQFACRNGRCISASWYCDSEDDCGDMSDEPSNCHRTCSSSQFTCRNGRCISRRWICDSDNDCGDFSDEMGCPNVTSAIPTSHPHYTTVRPCRSWQFTCGNGRCVLYSQCRDGINDCGDSTDETQCLVTCSSSQFTCQNGNCVPRSQRCDRNNDCGDYSDEIGCRYGTLAPTTARRCFPWEFTCSNARCVWRLYCGNGKNDCGDNSDETQCVATTTSIPRTCPPGRMHCSSGSRCAKRCDGNSECFDGSDERGCHTTVTPTPPHTCALNQFMCGNGQCIPKIAVCNGTAECHDHSDEFGCKGVANTTAIPRTCPPGRMLCTSGSKCAKRCDGKYECLDGSDERGCHTTVAPTPPHTCAVDQYTCANGQCIPKIGVCNGHSECHDHSDEIGCKGVHVNASACLNFPIRQFLCDNNQLCMTLSQRCDNRPDCRDKTDESNCTQHLQIAQVRAVSSSDCCVSVSWSLTVKSLPNWLRITGHRISFWPKVLHGVDQDPSSSSKNNKTSDIVGTKTTHLISDLEICSEYEVQIRVLGSRFYGPWSELYKVKTAITRTSAPQDINTTILNTSLQITWSPPKTICKTITMYQVLYETSKLNIPRLSYECKIVINDVDPNDGYTITVVAVSEFGGEVSTSLPGTFTAPMSAKQTGTKKGVSKLVWAIPVAIVGLLLLVLLVYFVRKSHRLQRSMYALLTRNSDETGGEVTFHSDEDDPLIRGFSDDVPLVTA